MAIDLKEYLELAVSREKKAEDVTVLLDVIPKAIEAGNDPHDVLTLLWGVVSGARFVDDEEQLDEMIRLAHELSVLVRGEKDKALCDYIFLVIYLKIGFEPKIVEAALKVVNDTGVEPVHMFAAYSELANMACAAGLYEKAREYGYRSLETLDTFNNFEKECYSVVVYGNLVSTLSNTSRAAEYREVKSKLLEMIQNGIENPYIQSVIGTVLIDVAVADIRMSGFNRERLEVYIRRVDDMVNGHERSTNSFHEPYGEQFIFRRMIREGMLSECARLLKTIVTHPKFFIGDFTTFYQLIESVYKKDSSLFTDAEIAKFRADYIELLKKNAEENRRISKHLMCEEFRINDIDTEYETVKAKYAN